MSWLLLISIQWDFNKRNGSNESGQRELSNSLPETLEYKLCKIMPSVCHIIKN